MYSLKRSRWLYRRLGCAVLVAAHVGLLATYRLDAHPYLTLTCLMAGFAGLGLFLVGSSHSPGLSTRVLLLMAVVLRLLLLPLPPTLSDDLLRYLWDGRVVAAGFNPYALAPEDAELRDLRDSQWEMVPHEDVPTVYPPLALASFSIAASLPLSLYVLKAFLALADLLGCLLLLGIARRRGLSLTRLTTYAWNPLVTLEVAGMGHIDALGVAAMIAAVAWLGIGRRSPARSAIWAGVGILAKLVPVVAVPMWARQSGRARSYLAVLALTAAAGLVPLVMSTAGVPPGLTRYAVSWEFNGPLFEPLWRGLEAAGAPDGVARLLDGLKSVTGWHAGLNRLYPYRYPQFLAKLLLWVAMLVLVWRSLSRRDPVTGTGWLLSGVMLCSATVYPWYLLWILPWAALCRQRAWLMLSMLIQLCYLPQLLELDLFPWYYVMIWVPFALLLIKEPHWSID